MSDLPLHVRKPNPEVYRTGVGIVLDFETTVLDNGSALNPENHLVLACWYNTGTRAYRHTFGGEYEQSQLVSDLAQCDFIVAHNAKFELQWLARCGFDTASKPVYDTMVGEWVLAGNRGWGRIGQNSLDACLKRRKLGGKSTLVSKMLDAGVCCTQIPRRWLLEYCKRDVERTHVLMQHQLREMEGTRLLPIQYTRCLLTPVLADIEFNGLHLDSKSVEDAYAEYTKRLTEVMAKLEELTGGINPKSSVQVAQYVYGELGFKEKRDQHGNYMRGKPGVFKEFPEGKPKTDEATLLSLNPTTEKQIEFMALKKEQASLSAALDKNLSMFVGAVRENDGMIYATLNQCTTGTHRLSSSGRSTKYEMFDNAKGCQFQNLPNIFKPMFTARREGWYVAEADYSQLEYRVAGLLTGDPVIYEEVVSKHDVHKYTASIMFEVDEEEVTYNQRRSSKADTFKPLYGGQSGTEAQKRYYKAFQEKYSVMNDAQRHWCELVGTYKMLETSWGMRYYWPKATVSPYGYMSETTKVFNYPIQAFATAEMVPIGLVMLWHRIRDAEMFLINTVHDSVEVELPENEIELFADTVVQALGADVKQYVREVYRIDIDMPIGVGMVIGKYWSRSAVSEEKWNEVNENLKLRDFHYDDGEVTATVIE